jgi:predicted nucleic acid-binding protein
VKVVLDTDCLVTGDKGLLALGEFNGHPILSPRQFLDRLPRPSTPDR